MSDPGFCNVCGSPLEDCDCPAEDEMRHDGRALLAGVLVLCALVAGCIVDSAPPAPEPMIARSGAEPETLIVPVGALDVVRLGIAVQACPMLEQFICNEPYPPDFFDFAYYTGYAPPENPEGWRVHWVGAEPPPNADFWNYFQQWASLTPEYRAAVIQYLRDQGVMP